MMINFKQVLATTSLITGAIISLSTGSAQAFSFQTGEALGTCSPIQENAINRNAPSPDLTSCETDNGLRLTAGYEEEGNPGNRTDPALLVGKKVGGIVGVGVNFDRRRKYGVDGEIDAGEYISLEVTEGPSIFDYIELSFLYQPGVYSDRVFEVAILETDQGTGTLRVTGDDTAEYSFNGKTTIINALSSSLYRNGGYYRIDNPFGDIKVGQVKLTAAGNADDNNTQHDYSLVGAKTIAQVPEPGSAAAILGLGLLVAKGSRRKKNIRF